ncbi:DNA-directed RNA polymerase I subunit RPA43 Twist neighbor protein [Channa argus]|uniref:DNA-directed RNA polymerase subunit n=1 Tax=Channa argus TaxID=215402 RepID=A0A6G1QYI8_CHAAH|nr:DNA-directed RNA polymerase I subunit RPA43 Twist neighbor protein [Channa argus]
MANLEHAEDDPKHVKISGEIPEAGTHADPAGVPPGQSKDAGLVPSSIPSFAAASALLSAPYSCLVLNTHRRHVALPPLYLKKKRTGIQEELDAELLKFSQSLRGVPLAYDNIKIVSQHGDIYDDNGYIHMDIEANFIVFQPKKGQRLLGKVNKLGVSHVGCLVHGCFNASIPKPNLVSVATWRDSGLRAGAELEFEVTALDADTAGVLLIRGRLERTRQVVQELMAMGESSESSIPGDLPDAPDTEPTPETAEESPEETPKKMKKKKKNKVNVGEREEEVMPSCQNDSNTTLELNGITDEANSSEAGDKKKKKKKKKKEKYLKDEEEEIEVSAMAVHGSDISGYVSDKPSTKRKHDTGCDDISGFNKDLAPPKSKKKRKSDTKKFV